MPSETAVREFITGAFRSVWSLELIQLLHSDRSRSFTRAELIDSLRASELVIKQCVDSLHAAGLIVVDEDDLIRLHAIDAETDALLGAAIALYGKSPDKVRRMIVAQTFPGVTAFADAFRLRKD